MAKNKKFFYCTKCGATYGKWQGQCSACKEWDSISEEQETHNQLGEGGAKISFVALDGKQDLPERTTTGMEEFDRVCGGGLVDSMCILVGGDPGIGKSTILLQVTSALAEKIETAYISGEESIDQIRIRAKRLHKEKSNVSLASTNSMRDIVTTLDVANPPKVVIIDSIQTLYYDGLDSAPGTVSQVRYCASELVRLAKKRNFVLIIVGHVTKEGNIAGPRVLEHMVDTVLYFEGDRGHQFRILRAVKNRFGATDEIGVFEMTDMGLSEVHNPSALFLNDRQENVHGSCVFAGMEGTRPVLMEIQALVATSSLGMPRRSVLGWESSRLSMILAVLEARCGLQFSNHDVYLNIAGGIKINEPGADLAVAAALCSALSGNSVPNDAIVFGEIGLSGEIRSVGQSENRLKEATKLGFTKAIIPHRNSETKNTIQLKTISHIIELVNLFKND